jgi:hypothetical protein
MVHDRQRLAFGEKALDQNVVVESGTDELESQPLQRSGLLGEPNLPHPALADLSEQAIGAEHALL